jgi:leucyl aminopeptidase
MNITFAKHAMPKSGALIVTATQGGKLAPAAAAFDKAQGGILKRAMSASKFQGKRGQIVDVLAPGKLGLSRVVLLGIGAPGELTAPLAEAVGGLLSAFLTGTADGAGALMLDPIKSNAMSDDAFAAHLAMGASLRDYQFDTYRTKRDTSKAGRFKLTVMSDAATGARSLFKKGEAGVEGTKVARDLMTEPPNVLYPASFAKRCQQLSKLGVSVQVLGEKEMKKLGMDALLGVGQGSVRDSQLVVMHWPGANGAKPGKKTAAKNAAKAKSKTKSGPGPIAFVGKGVCFDSGGISLKPGAGMEEMKGDMGGAAAVTGLMHALATRKAKCEVVGVIALAENMPDGNAQRPGDIVKSMSGQTIEIINTDAEGRLVLADALWYTNDRFKPQMMIDLATLTGAIVISLASEYAGLFTEDERMAGQLAQAGFDSGEKVWRMPLGDAYDKMIDSQFADMKNTGGRAGGSITAAQFLRRFVGDTPWAHLDIASTAWRSKPTETSPTWATGFGVRLLDKFIADNYER